jgi:hypothetical protein
MKEDVRTDLSISSIHSSWMSNRRNLDASLKVAVIGAGASGLTAAHTLRKLGYKNIVVFEKENRPGGKVFSYEHKGRVHELGAVLLADRYVTVYGLADEFNIPLFTANEIGVVRDKKYYDYEHYILKHMNVVGLMGSLVNFWRMQHKFPEIRQPGFSKVHKDLHLPLTEFAKKYHIESVTQLVASFMTGCGYGYYEEIPAMYLLKLIPQTINGSLRLLLGLSGQHGNGVTNGWQSMWQTIADSLDVRYNAGVTRVSRSHREGRDVVEITVHGQPTQFDVVVLAAPLEAARDFLDLREKEKELFAKINTYHYAVTLFEGKDLPHASLVDSVRPDMIGKVVAFARHHPDLDLYTAYQLLPEGVSEEESIAKIGQAAAALGGTCGAIIHRKHWRYFPWVSQADLNAGYYGDLESLQGVHGTYYVGSLMNFETVETTAAYAKALMVKHFAPADIRAFWPFAATSRPSIHPL